MFVRAACIEQNTYTRNYLIIFSKIYVSFLVRLEMLVQLFLMTLLTCVD